MPLTPCDPGRASGCGKSRRETETASNGACLARQSVVASENASGNGNAATATACDATEVKKKKGGKRQGEVISMSNIT